MVGHWEDKRRWEGSRRSFRGNRKSAQWVGKTHCQGRQDPSKRVPIFLGTDEANVKMVPICGDPTSRLRTVLKAFQVSSERSS